MGSVLPVESQKELIKLRLKPGCLIHLFCKTTLPPKNKFIVVVHIDYQEDLLLCFYMNSRINGFIKSKPELERCQITLQKSRYKFLDNDSYLDCSEVEDDIEIDDVLNHLLENQDDFKCSLVEEDILEIIQAVNISKNITDFDKKLIINSLGN